MEGGHGPSAALPAPSAPAPSSTGPEKTPARPGDAAQRRAGSKERSLKCVARLRAVGRLLVQLLLHILLQPTADLKLSVSENTKHQ